MIGGMQHGMGIVILAGTFHHLHAGHRALLAAAAKAIQNNFAKGHEGSMAASSHGGSRAKPRHAGSKVDSHLLIGLMSDDWLKKQKKGAQPSYAQREKNLRLLLAQMKLLPHCSIFELNDKLGPAVFDCGADTLVVSQETQKTGEEINRHRIRKKLPPLRLIVVPLSLAQDGLPISSSRIDAGVIDANGRRLIPLRITLGSSNPSKLKGAQAACRRAFPGVRTQFRAFSVSSGVHEQPVGFELTWKGALNRARGAFKKWPKAEYAIGLESGLIPAGGRLFDFQLCALTDASGRVSSGCSMGFPLPKKVEEGIFGTNGKRAGRMAIKQSLGQVVDKLSGQKDIGKKHGALYFLSRALLSRQEMTVQAVLCAMVERLSPV